MMPAQTQEISGVVMAKKIIFPNDMSRRVVCYLVYTTLHHPTVDGRNPAPVEVVFIHMVLYIPGGAGFLPSTVPLPKKDIGQHSTCFCPSHFEVP